MNYKILSVAILMSVNMMLPMIDNKKVIEEKQSCGQDLKKSSSYRTKVLEMIINNIASKSKLEQEQMIKAESEQKKADTSFERRKQFMMSLCMFLD